MDAKVLIDLLGILLATAAAFYVLMLRPWRPVRLLRNRAPSIDLLFIAALAVGSLALYRPEPFDRSALWLVDQTDLPQTLDAVDERIAAIEALPERLWADLMERFGWADDPPADDAVTTEPGRARAAVMPAVIGITSGVLRSGAYAGSLLAIALCQAMRIAVGARRMLRSPERESRAELEARVASLEAAMEAAHSDAVIAPSTPQHG